MRMGDVREVPGIAEVGEVGGVTKNLFPSRPPFYLNSQVNRHSASTSKICSSEPASQSPSPSSRAARRVTSRTTRHLASIGGVVWLSRLKTGTHACISKPVPIEDAPRPREMRCTTASGGKRCRK